MPMRLLGRCFITRLAIHGPNWITGHIAAGSGSRSRWPASNTANIGSIQKIADLLSGNGVFSKAGEELFDDYWANFGKIEILVNGKRKKLSSFEEYLQYRRLPPDLNNPKASKRKSK